MIPILSQLCNRHTELDEVNILQRKLQIEHQEFNVNDEKLIIMKYYHRITTLIIEKGRLSNV